MTSARLTSPVRTLIAAAATAALLAVVPVTTGHAAPPVGHPPSVATAKQQVAALQLKMERATEAYDTARAQLQQSQDRAHELRLKADTQQRKVNDYKARVAAFASGAYTSGSASQLSSLLESGSPQTFVDQVTTLDQISKNQRELLSQLVNAEKALKQEHRQINAEVARQAARARTVARQKAVIEQDLAHWRRVAKQAQIAAARRVAAARAAAERRAHQAAVQRAAGTQNAPGSAAPAPPSNTGAASGSAAAAVQFAYGQLGKPYAWGAAGPSAYDCSGLTMASWAAAGVSLPHSAAMQYSSGMHVPLSALQPGDLVFFGSPIHHVGIYIGGGNMIHAPTFGEVVQISPITIMPVVGAVRP